MTGTTVRLLIVAALVAMIHVGSLAMQQWLKPPNVKLPDWDLRDLPLTFGSWKGEKIDLESQDPRMLAVIGARLVVDREYRNVATGQRVTVHTAMFDEYDVGMFHGPMNCYRSNAWQRDEEKRMDLQVPGGATVPISVSTWQRQADRVMVGFWYQLGGETILSRLDLGTVGLKLRGRESWPPLIKVLMQTSATESDTEEEGMRELAEYVYRWMNRPDSPAKPASPPE
jgi:EpsI family protein